MDPDDAPPKPDDPGPDPKGPDDPELPRSEPDPPRSEPDPPPVGGTDSDRLDRIESVVNGLVDIVAALAPKDEAPTKLPWTHRFGREDRR